MPDDLTKKIPQDASKINIHDEVNYWTDALKCTKAQLISVVNAVGV